MRIGFLVWNQFQVAQSAEIARHFVDPDFIFIDRDSSALKDFSPAWLVPYGAYSRFVPELELQSLDGQYDAVVAQFRPPLKAPWSKTKLIIQQYSLAKPKTAYNSRWFSADHGLVYGAYSEAIIGQMCPVSQSGNPRFDPNFEGRLDSDVLHKIRSRLDPEKKTVLYQPTWGDLSTSAGFSAALADLADDFNVVVRPHHMTSIKAGGGPIIPGTIGTHEFPSVLDIGIYLNQVADIVVSDMSGAIFDALYCGKKVVLIGDDALELSDHKKADSTAIEVSERHRIGPYVSDPSGLRRAVTEMADRPELYKDENESLVRQCFLQRGGCAALASQAIREAVNDDGVIPRPPLQRYVGPDLNVLMAKAYASAQNRHARQAAGPGAGKKRSSAKDRARRTKTKSFVRNKTFFEAGSQLEAWRNASRKQMAASIYQAFHASSALRFSQSAWKEALARLLSSTHSPGKDAGNEVLRKIGMLRTLEAICDEEQRALSNDVASSITTLGSLADFFDLAARNELAPGDGQQYIASDGSHRPVGTQGIAPVVELYLALSVCRELKDEDQRPYRSSQLRFAQNIFDELLKLGVGVYPRLQGGVTGVAPVSASPPMVKFTWHTIDYGLAANIHLKIGSLFGHFILDEKGYSGWGSPAGMSIESSTARIGAEEANSHWERLYGSLVEEGKSKYSQEAGEVPDVGDYIFFPMQVYNDTVAKLADIGTHSLLEALVEWAKTSELKVVVKRHPMCRSAAIAATLAEGQADGHIIISNANIHHLIAGAKCVVTVNSGVGAEALLHLKPVITTGGSDYAPATRRVRTVQELVSVLDDRAWRAVGEDDIKKFLFFYTKRYMVEFSDREALSLRLRSLLSGVGIDVPAAANDSMPQVVFPGVGTDIRLVAAHSTPAEKRKAEQRQACAEAVRELLGDLRGRGIVYWLDGSSLARVARNGSLNQAARWLHLGILVEDYQALRASLLQCARYFGLSFEEKKIDGVPYAATMARRSPRSRFGEMSIALRFYYELDGDAWSPHRVSLIANSAGHAKARYRESVYSIPASFGEKVNFMVSNPVQGASIVLDSLGLARIVRRLQKRQGVLGKLAYVLFTEFMVTRIPMAYLASIRVGEVDMEALSVPAPLDEYLTQRYGWSREPQQGGPPGVGNDRFSSRIDRREFEAALQTVRRIVEEEQVSL